ncbi:MAG TPA: hypothetical protein VHZ74_10795 [Bryobacteraceae bacterium]|jgi:hypothetical protein|nr:hypothetical protein [Bryobacteraceae bacterium]
MSAQLALSRRIHEEKLLELVASPEPKDKFGRDMRAGSIEYRKSAIRAIDRLNASDEGADNCKT